MTLARGSLANATIGKSVPENIYLEGLLSTNETLEGDIRVFMFRALKVIVQNNVVLTESYPRNGFLRFSGSSG